MAQINKVLSSPPKTCSSKLSPLVSIGDSTQYLNIGLNLFVTTAVMLQFPRQDMYDTSWKENGLCYVLGLEESTNDEISNEDQYYLSTNLLCAASLAFSGIFLLLWSQKGTPLYNQHAALAHRCSMFGQSNLSHGFGHFFLHMTGNVVPKVELSLSDPKALGYLLVLLMFWPTVLRGVMPKITTRKAILASIFIIAAQIILDVPPKLSFAFSQSVILLGASFDQLLMTQQKEKNDNDLLYMINAFYFLPLWPLMWLEVTQCSNLLSKVGGHLFYDGYLSIMPFLTTLVVKNYGSNTVGGDTKRNKTRKVV